MKKFFVFLAKTIGSVVGLIVLVVFSIFAVARFSDGPIGNGPPIEMVTAGPFKTGELQVGGDEPDWSFLKDYPIVQFQLLGPLLALELHLLWKLKGGSLFPQAI